MPWYSGMLPILQLSTPTNGNNFGMNHSDSSKDGIGLKSVSQEARMGRGG